MLEPCERQYNAIFSIKKIPYLRRSIVVELDHRTSLVEFSYGNLRKHIL